jgi:hypothetical protein
MNADFPRNNNFLSKLLLTSPVAKEEKEGRSKPGGRSFLYQNKFSLGITLGTKRRPFQI